LVVYFIVGLLLLLRAMRWAPSKQSEAAS
jgi:hypothetical protein